MNYTTAPELRHKRAIIYCRVSTDKQEQDGESLEYQEEKCRRYAELHDIDVVTVLHEAKSGYIHYSLREKLTLARQFIRDGLADMIIVWDLRRFSRNFVHSAMIFEEIESKGAEIVSVSENIDNSLTGKLIRSILAWSAELEREKIVEYANRHWQKRRERQLPIATGYPSYGWNWGDAEKTYYVVNHEEAAVRFSIFHMFVELDMSLRSIAHTLTEDGVPTPIMTRYPHSKRGHVWNHTTIYDMLHDLENVGILTILKWHNTLSDKGTVKRVPHPERLVIPGGIPAIIPVSLYERAQRKLAANKAELSRLPKDPTLFLLRGHVRCGSCGRRMCTHIHKQPKHVYPKYCCTNFNNKDNKCPDTPWVRADLVDAIVWEECCRLFDRQEALQAKLEQAIATAVETLLEDTTGQEQLAELEATIEYAKTERRKHPEGSYTYNLITQNIQAKEDQLERYKEVCTSSRSIAAATRLYQERTWEFLDFLNVMRGNYQRATFQQKRNALDVLGVMVTLEAAPPEERRQGREATVERLRPRVIVTYSPLFTGVGTSPKELQYENHQFFMLSIF